MRADELIGRFGGENSIRSRVQRSIEGLGVDFNFLNLFYIRGVKQVGEKGEVPSCIWGDEVRNDKVRGRGSVWGKRRGEQMQRWNP